MKDGFTLVELSIVLVIIGLLIGGILVGQSLIDSAQMNQAIRQIQQYDIAVSNFRERFRQLPGDSSLMIPAGNNDRDIRDPVPGGDLCDGEVCEENYSFWKHLTDANVLEGSYTNNWVDEEPSEGDQPDFLDAPLIALSIPFDTAEFNPAGWFYRTSSHIAGESLVAIDVKIDDTDPTTGFVRNNNADHGPGNAFVGPTCGAVELEGGSYNCIASITIMSTNGTPLDN